MSSEVKLQAVLPLPELYRQMYTIRRFEETVLELFSRGLLNGTTHTCIGQEACAVGVLNAIDKTRDIVWSNHRAHGHYIALFDDVDGLMAELMGKESGVCGGVGGSQHLHRGNFYTNGVQGGIVPIAVGMALAEKRKQSRAIVVVFLGDGTLGQGIVYESFNLASLWQLPVLFVVENNQYAQTTPVRLAHAGALDQRAIPFGIRTSVIEVDHVRTVLWAAMECVEYVRREVRPALLFMNTYRLSPHSKGDDFRPAEEVAAYRTKDPLIRVASELAPDEREQIESNVERRVALAVDAAQRIAAQDFNEYRKRMVQIGGVYAW